VRAPLTHQLVRSYVMDQPADWIDELARKSPTALTMALERAIAMRNLTLERAVLKALGELGIVVFDRSTLVDTLAAAKAARAR